MRAGAGMTRQRLHERLSEQARRILRPVAGLAGADLVEGHFYSPIPDVDALPAALWERPSELHGIQLDLRAQLDFIEGVRAAIAEFRPPSQRPEGRAEYYLDNGMYGRVDADLLYAMIRSHYPKRVLELGFGFSSLVIRAASQKNATDGNPLKHRMFDPFPNPQLASAIRGGSELQRIGATDVPLAEFEALERNDILFVDTTHTVKTGGDVNYLVLDVLPLLRPGVLVHFHDIFLPWEYPRSWLKNLRRYWAEQYLLQAFLAMNDRYAVVLANYALTRAFPSELVDLIPSSATPGPSINPPNGFWIRRLD